VVVKTPLHAAFESLCQWCKRQRDSAWLTTLVTATIVAVGLLIGVETDQFLSCNRYTNRANRPDTTLARCEVTFASNFMEVASQAIFTGEAVVKVLAEGYEPYRYLNDPWNCLDAFVVSTGFVQMTPARVIFEAFPVVVLRLLRLLRVFRLAKALPRLRSIVEALMEGFSAVGWIVLLIVVFNYIVACMFMLFLKGNDPFHFGTLSRAMVLH
jgi:voltage-gated sodium channel